MHLNGDNAANISEISRQTSVWRVPLTLLDSMVGPECEPERLDWSAWSRRVHSLIGSHARACAHAHLRSSFTWWTLVCYLKYRVQSDCIHYKDGGSGETLLQQSENRGSIMGDSPPGAHMVLFCYKEGHKRQSSLFHLLLMIYSGEEDKVCGSSYLSQKQHRQQRNSLVTFISLTSSH